MDFIEIDSKKIELNEDGFLKELGEWNTGVAEAISLQEGIELSEKHWIVITFVREYYTKYNVPPMMKKVLKSTGLNLKELFSNNPVESVMKIAGLPKPTGCV
ncbi:MAG: Sulfurtransferase TusE [Candidatus Dichloromethanomonas elyunquensis]|nr:MAG: Sulfurtransferase TusE [Candidatus Dichloromethanomonas elyunquensis]